MKKILIMFLIIFTISSCQDEFCLEGTTPNLIITFYDKNSDEEEAKPIELILSANSLEDFFTGIATDSISIPIDTQNNTVTYRLSILDSIGSEEEINISYIREDVFVSKACGFKTVFKDFSFSSTKNNWINKTEQVVTEITNETQTHVKIFH